MRWEDGPGNITTENEPGRVHQESWNRISVRKLSSGRHSRMEHGG